VKGLLGLLLAALLCGGLLFSCKSLPPAADSLPEGLLSEEPAAESPAEGRLAEEALAEEPLPLELPPEDPPPVEDEPAEVLPDLAESGAPPVPPAEEELSLILPEPEEPPLPSPAGDSAPGEEDSGEPGQTAAEGLLTEGRLTEGPETGSAGTEDAGAGTEPEEPPAPPSFLGPAEEIAPRAAAPSPGTAGPVTPLRPAEPERPSPGDIPALRQETPALPRDGISHSRTLRAGVGQIVEIPFRGSGWVFLGELDSRTGTAYLDRRSDDEGMVFRFRAGEPGDFVLGFYRQDFIRDFIQNDHVRLVVAEAVPGAPAVVTAPRWPGREGAPEAGGGGISADDTPAETSRPAGGSGPAADATPATDSRPAGDATPPEAAAVTAPGPPARLGAETPPAEFLRLAREEHQAGRSGEALGILDRFRELYPLGSDEAWWLYGQALETAGPQRNIRAALEYYRRLVQEYPQSPRCADARRRIAHLERFYFNIP
jgi:TolA-binding protein